MKYIPLEKNSEGDNALKTFLKFTTDEVILCVQKNEMDYHIAALTNEGYLQRIGYVPNDIGLLTSEYGEVKVLSAESYELE